MHRAVPALALILAFTLAAGAQWRGTRVDPETDPKAFDITTRADLEDSMRRVAALRGQFAAARSDREREQVIESILRLCQDELNKQANASGAVAVEHSSDSRTPGLAVRWTGAWHMVEDTILALGPAALAQYEKIYGPRAVTLVREAMALRDLDGLAALNRRFGLTAAGFRAATLLAATWWESGEVSRAARALERALFAPALVPAAQRAALTAWLSHCYRDLGERANLNRLLRLDAALRDAMVDEGGSQSSLDAILRRNLAGARDRAADTLSSTGIEWPGGNYTNTALPPAPGKWSVTAWARALPRHAAEPHQYRFMGYPAPIATPYMPVCDGSMVYVNTGERLVAYDLIGAGAGDGLAWSCTAFPAVKDVSWRTSEPDPSLILPVSIHRGTVYAALENPLDAYIHERNADGMFGLYSHYPQMRRALCAVDAATGRLLWKLGGLYAGRADDTTSFLYAVVHDGTLYAVGSRSPGISEIFLYALDPASGEVRWNLRLCYGQQETTMFGRPARTPYPSLCAISGGTMYLCTNIGGVVAVDLSRRCLNWISRYEYVPRPITKYTETYYREPTWANNPTLYCEPEGQAIVVVAPTDADTLFGLDAGSGEILWSLDRNAQLRGGRFLCGVRKGVAWVAGDGGFSGAAGSGLVGVNVREGKAAQSRRAEPAGGPLALAGRPCLAGSRMYWPGYNAQGCSIAEIELDTLRALADSRAPQSYAGQGYSVYSQHGMIFTVSGSDYALGNSQLSLRCDQAELLEAARRQAAADPENPEGILRLGLLQLRLGNPAEALETLRRAFEKAGIPPVNTHAREAAARALVHAHLESADALLLARKHAEALAQVEVAASFALLRSQRSDCFVRRERALKALGDAPALRALYEELAENDPDFGVGEDPEIPARLYGMIRLAEMIEAEDPARAAGLYQQVQEGPERLSWERTRLRTWALARLKALLRAAGREVYRPQDDAAGALLRQGDAGALSAILLRFPLAADADEAALRLAAMAMQRRDAAQAVRVLAAALEDNTLRPRVAELQAWLALAHDGAGEKLRARLLAARTLREFPQGELTREGRREKFKDVLGPIAGGAAPAGARAPLPRLPAQLQELWTRPWQMRSFTRVPALPPSPAMPRLYLTETTPEGVQTVCLDAPSGELIWRSDQAVFVVAVHETDAGVVLETQQGFQCVDDQGGERWTVHTGGPPGAVSLEGGMLVYAARYRTQGERPGNARSMVRIAALDVSSGGEIWRTEYEASLARWISQGAAGILALVRGSEQRLLLLDPETGRETKAVTLNLPGPVDLAPSISDGVLWLVDGYGGIRGFRTDDLAPAGAFNTGQRGCALLRAENGRLWALGSEGVTCFDLKSGNAVLSRAQDANEQFRGAQYSSGVYYVFSRDAAGGARVSGISAADCAPLFRVSAARAEKTDRLKVQASSAFDGGVCVVFSVQSLVEGVLRLTAFHMLVLNADGSERLNRPIPVEGVVSHFAQLAVIEDHLLLACGNVTHCFGRPE